ncbi:hypothetical protein ACHWQZ_G016258 [Mnemiopsis leidyi]
MNFSPPNCGLICSSSTLNDKSTQTGEFSADNHISTPTTACSPSKCLNCQTVNKTTSRTLLDGILRITTEKVIVLCNIHISADSTPPSPSTYPEPGRTVPDLDISINTQDILTSLEQNPDPLNLLPISTNHQTFDSLTAAPSTSLLNLPTSFNRKKKRSSQTKLDSIHQNYTRVLELVKRGNPVADAIKRTGIAKSTFYEWKPIAELKIVDGDRFRYFLELEEDATILLRSCKKTLSEDYTTLMQEMRKEGQLLKKY